MSEVIWFKNWTLEELKHSFPLSAHMGTHLGIELTKIGADFLQGQMPVDEKTKQPFGILHGGASCVLAESLGSTASFLVLDPEKFMAVGMTITASHLRSVKSGRVTAIARPIHLGRQSHLWDIEIVDEDNKKVCVSRLTMAVLPVGGMKK